MFIFKKRWAWGDNVMNHRWQHQWTMSNKAPTRCLTAECNTGHVDRDHHNTILLQTLHAKADSCTPLQSPWFNTPSVLAVTESNTNNTSKISGAIVWRLSEGIPDFSPRVHLLGGGQARGACLCGRTGQTVAGFQAGQRLIAGYWGQGATQASQRGRLLLSCVTGNTKG